jgi:hypothetical protein
MEYGLLFLNKVVLEGLAQDVRDVTAAHRQFIPEEHPVVRQRDFPRQRHLTAADQPDIGYRVMRGAR